MTRGKLKKISSTHQRLRTNVIDGWFLDTPKVGHSFVMFADPIDPETDLRVVETTPVREVRADSFDTENSTYELVTE